MNKPFTAGGPKRSKEGRPYHRGPGDTKEARNGRNPSTTSALATATGRYGVVSQRPAAMCQPRSGSV